MVKYWSVVAALLFLVVGLASPVLAADEATPNEVYEKVLEAANVLENLGKEGLKAFQGKDSEFVWKDSYVFVVNCSTWKVVAHPVQPSLVGKMLKNLKDKKTGRLFFQDFCKAAKNPQGGWVEYWWPKPGQPKDKLFRKITFVVQVPGQPFQVLAGIYNDTVTLKELEGSK